MSWYVRKLLLNKEVIESNVESLYKDDRKYGFGEPYSYLEEKTYMIFDFDSDVYSDLLSIEMTIKSLNEKGLFSKLEKTILNDIMNGYRISDIMEERGLSRPTVVKKITEICNRIAYALGFHFTDQGYLEYLAEKYYLTKDQIEKIEKIIKEET